MFVRFNISLMSSALLALCSIQSEINHMIILVCLPVCVMVSVGCCSGCLPPPSPPSLHAPLFLINLWDVCVSVCVGCSPALSLGENESTIH